MAEIVWTRSPPLAPSAAPGLRDWAERLISWIEEQEQGPGTEIEESLALGGTLMASRLFGNEGIFSGYTAPEATEILSAPVAPRKKVLVAATATVDANNIEIRLVHKKGGVSVFLAIVVTDTGGQNSERSFRLTPGALVVLDADDETIELHVEVAAGNPPVHWSLSYIDVD